MQILEAMFIFCVVWSCGAALVQRPQLEDRDRFDAFVKSVAGLGSTDNDRVPPSQLPVKSIYEYCFDKNDKCWRSWRSYIKVSDVITGILREFSYCLLVRMCLQTCIVCNTHSSGSSEAHVLIFSCY